MYMLYVCIKYVCNFNDIQNWLKLTVKLTEPSSDLISCFDALMVPIILNIIFYSKVGMTTFGHSPNLANGHQKYIV